MEMTPVTLSIVLILGIFLFSLPRQKAIVPILICIFLIPLAPRIFLIGNNFTAQRILIIFGLLRLTFRAEWDIGFFTRIDKAFVLWTIWMVVAGGFLEGKAGLLNRFGYTLDAIGSYMLFRALLRNYKDLEFSMVVIGVLFCFLGMEMLFEKLTDQNLFYYIGSEFMTATVREGKVRAAGPFTSYITAGTAGAAYVPILFALRSHPDASIKRIATIGLVMGLCIVYSCASSGPILSVLAGIGGMLLWPYRYNMKAIHLFAIFMLVCLQLSMKVPVWYLMGRIDLVGGSTGYHRAELISSAFAHFNEWWLVGTTYTRHWMETGVTWSKDHTDITNHFLYYGVIGGLFLILFFIRVLSRCFRQIDYSIRQFDAPDYSLLVVWAMGSSLFAHVITFFSVAYFDQIVFVLYLLFAQISLLQFTPLESKVESSETEPTIQPQVAEIGK